MENNLQETSSKVTAKDFFLHLGVTISLYATVIAFLNLIFKVIDKSFPHIIDTNIYYWSGSSEISMPVATLIVVFPVLICLSFFVYKSYEKDQSKKNLGIRKWLTYVTLFIAGLILAGDLILVIYKFLDGQDLTQAFLLKSISLFVVLGVVFCYYLQDLRDKITNRQRKIWAICVGVIILASIILGFSIMGSPRTQRLLRYDQEKIIQLSNMQWTIINYWIENGVIPEELPNPPVDKQTGKFFEYIKTGDMTYKICAEFNKERGEDRRGRTAGDGYGFVTTDYRSRDDNWNHPAGRYCFEREVDSVAYPTRVEG